MKLNTCGCCLLSIAFVASPLAAEESAGLDGAKGHIHQVDPKESSFQLLKETEYDPKTDIGQSRFTIHWDDKSRVQQIEEAKSFQGIEGPVMAVFHGIRDADRKAMAAGKLFEARVVTIHRDPGFTPPDEVDPNKVIGMFTPDLKQDRAGSILIDGKPVVVRLRPKFWRIYVHDLLKPEALADGFWKTTIHGEQRGDQFVIEEMEVSRLPDPRETDDPKLPRVLVIGDSISMNYHEAAKAALKGVANYHRCEGNAFSSAHGVRNSELWMGSFKEPGFQWDVIQFNHGLHDLKQAYDKSADAFGEYAVSLKEYQQNLEKMIAILKQSGAKLIWCSTTPVPNDSKGTYARRKGAAKEFNAAAMEVMGRHPEILVSDLHGFIDGSPIFDEWRKTQDVHFYRDTEKVALGDAVAGMIRQALADKR